MGNIDRGTSWEQCKLESLNTDGEVEVSKEPEELGMQAEENKGMSSRCERKTE